MSNKFKINNGLIYTDGNQTSGYVLTSDANGNATWQVTGAGSGLWVVGSAGVESLRALNTSTVDAIADRATAWGEDTYASGYASTAGGRNSVAQGQYSVSIGAGCYAGLASFPGPIGSNLGIGSFACNAASAGGDYSHAEGNGTRTFAEASHAEGYFTSALGIASHAEGDGGSTYGGGSHIEGGKTIGGTHIARGDYSHVGGVDCLSTSAATGSFVHGSGSTVSSRNTYVFGVNITGSLENTMYVPNLVVKKTIVPSTSADSVGEQGSVSWDNTYFYVKTGTGWGRVALSYAF